MIFKPKLPDYKKLVPDFLEDFADAIKEFDPGFPTPFGPVFQITICVNSNHAHEQNTRKSLTGILGFVGSQVHGGNPMESGSSQPDKLDMDSGKVDNLVS